MPNPNFGTANGARQVMSGFANVPVQDDSRPNISDLSVSSWATDGQTYAAVGETTAKLPAGFYACRSTMNGPVLESLDMANDDLVSLEDETIEVLTAEFIKFWDRIPQFEERGLSAKRGLLLWGPPGSGKTSALQIMSRHMVNEMDGIVVLADEPQITSILLAAVRKVEPTRPVILLMEDIDALVGRFGEAGYLALLDGELQISNIVHVATTNYPERLDKRFADRPGRFDRVEYVGMPNDKARRLYLESRAPNLSEIEIERFVKASDGWSIAHLRELVVASEILGDDPQVTIDRLDEMTQHQASSDASPDKQLAGFR